MLRLFLDNRIGVLLLLPVFLLLYILTNMLFTPTTFGVSQSSSFFNLIDWGSTGNTVAQFLLLLLNAVTLNWVFNSQEFLEKNTYIISLNYILFNSFFIDFGKPSWILMSQFFLILTLALFFGIRPQNDSRKPAFNAGFLIGISLLFNSLFLLLIPIAVLMLLVVRLLNLRELFLLLLGIIAPIGLLYATQYILQNEFHFPLTITWSLQSFNWIQISILAILHLLLIFSIIGLRARLLKASLRLKKQVQVLNIFMFSTWILGLCTFIFLGQNSILSLMVLPLSFYFSYALLSSKLGISSHLFFYIILLSSLLKFMVLSF